MRLFRPVMAAFSVLFSFVLMPVFHGFAEDLYRWKDPSGVLCFSNVSPPGGVREYSILTAVPSVANPMVSTGAFGDAGGDAEEKPAKDEPGVQPGSMVEFLRDRILVRETSISRLEALLKSQPNSAYLRKCLFEKKQKLHEDNVRLELISD